MRAILRFLLSLSVAAALPLSAQSLSSVAPPARFADPQRAAKLAAAFPTIDSLMRAAAERFRVPGIAYGIIIDGRVAHIGVAGLREVASRSPVDTNTVFRIASMSKSFAAAAILQLRDAGRLALDDPVEKYVPELRGLAMPTSDSPKITIRHLLTHSEGFPEDNPWGDQQLSASEADLSRMMRGGIPFSNAPGVAYEYSNYGFAILGRVVANVSGMPYTRYLTERILKPLGMNSTTMEAASVPPNRLAHGYRWQDNAWLEEKQLPDGAFGPMGGMLTSVADLSKWVALMLDAWPPRDGPETGPLKRSSLREMQQVARFSGASANRDTSVATMTLSGGGYGYGLGVTQTCLFAHGVAHGGGLPGFGSTMRWFPELGLGIVAFGNLTYTVVGAEGALQALRRTGALVPREPQPAPVLVERRAQVSRLVSRWNDALADTIAAMNLYLDQSKDRRKAAIERLVNEAGGSCANEGPFEVQNALRGRWRMRCRNGDLRVTITLAPTVPATVQALSVAPMRREDTLAPPASCR
jgi:CubicO group peptidase (beta-lactamase class C family)